MTTPPVILARPFLPAQDFEVSKSFYEALGFTKLLDGEVAIFACGDAPGFILQPYYAKEWAENCMMQLMVEDLDAWWAHIGSLDLPGRFGTLLKAPWLQAWGLREVHMIDPAGVLWHVTEPRPGRPFDRS